MEDFSRYPLISADVALARIGNKKELYAKLLGSFVRKSGLESVQEALLARDLNTAILALHATNGLAANLSLIRLQKVADSLEAKFKKARSEGDYSIFDKIEPSDVTEVFSDTVDEATKLIATL